MTENDKIASTPGEEHHRYTFGQFTLDVERGALLKDGVEVALRPKGYMVLAYLIEHHGVLLTRDELLAEVWPDMVVTEDSLTQCLIQIRKALGDTKKEMIRTIPRRGFIFEAPVTIHPHAESSESETIQQSWQENRKPSRWSMIAAVVLALAIAASWWSLNSRQVSDLQDNAQVLPNSIAVLPFVNMSDDGANEYFADGLSEELLNLLTQIPQLQVAARTSSFSFKGKNINIPQVARELNVAYVLEGSVRKAGKQVRVSAQLIKAEDGFHLWSETYDRDLGDIFKIQDDISSRVVAALKIPLLGAMPAARQTDPEVYSLYLQGKYFDNRMGKEDLKQSLTAYTQALAIDPDYAPAWIGLSVAYQNHRKFGWMTEKEAFDLSMAAIEKALAIDRDSAEAWASLGYLRKQRLDWTGAVSAIDKALMLEPNNPFVLGTAASLAGNLGQIEKSIELFERNVALNPLRLASLRALGLRYAFVGRFDEAFKNFNKVLAMKPDFPGIHFAIGATYLLSGDPERALLEVEKNSSAPVYPFHKLRVLSTLGDEAQAQAIIEKLLQKTAFKYPNHMAATYAWRGENDLAFEWYERTLQQQPGALGYFLESAWARGLSTDPRYPAFVEKLGLLEYWKRMPKTNQKLSP